MQRPASTHNNIFCLRPTQTMVLTAILVVMFSARVQAWQKIDTGIQIQTFKVVLGKKKIREISIIRIDPLVYDFKLITTGHHGRKPATIRDWSKQENLIAAINASMYQENHRQSTGYMKTRGQVNNGYINPRFGAFLVFGPRNPSLPDIQIIDRSHQDWQHLITQYDTVIQNFRLISAKQENLWPETEKSHSIAAVGMDIQGHVLFMHCQLPLSIHEFNEALLGLPIGIFNAMYVEGGAEAAMYLKTDKLERSWPGRYEDPLLGTINQQLWAIPNVIGVVPKKHTSDHTQTDKSGVLPCK